VRRGLLVLVASLAAIAGARADERILAWQSDIHVLRDSTLEVTETLRVRAGGQQIRRGLLRDFPTRYVDRRGQRVVTGFEVVAVRRDGRAEPHALEKLANGVRIRIGDPEVYLSPGEYEYAITYRTDRQLGLFAEHDELYWNVTGNGWDFPIDTVVAQVFLPGSIEAAAIEVEAYTGPQGAQGRDWQADAGPSLATFRTTRGLGPREGLTIVVVWPMGHVTPPGRGQRAAWLLRDAWPAAVALGGLALLLAYYVTVWRRVGRDPPPRVIVPRYAPPAGLSPAAMRFLRRMAYDDRCFAAAVLSLAVQGALRIEQASGGFLKRAKRFTLNRTEPGKDAVLAEDERALRDKLFSTAASVEIDDANHAVINSAKLEHLRALKARYMPSAFRANGAWHALGIVLSLLIGAFGVLLPAVKGGFGPSWWFMTTPGRVALGVAVLALVANAAFGRWLKAPTVAGRATMDHVEGFRLYLDVAEGDEVGLVDAPPLNVGLYERYLPAALALEVEQRWAQRFASVFATQAVAHSPAWYSGDAWDTHDVARFTSGFGDSFSSAISSASTAPGSSSGSGGGGSSGGGGGGGGGGGW
jgi:uncharacterized membrane protein YgcG